MDAIYSGIPGARKQTLASFSGDVWILDCKSEVNASIKIGGKTYPIHPLDLSRTGVDDSGNTICYGTVRVANFPGPSCGTLTWRVEVPTGYHWGSRPDLRCDLGNVSL